MGMESVTLTRLHEIPDDHLAQLVAGLERERNLTAAGSPRVATVFVALLKALAAEARRRQGVGLLPSAEPVTVLLPTAGELSDDEMRDLMRQMLHGRTAFGGGTPAVARFFDAVLDGLKATRSHQDATLTRLEQDFAGPGC